MSNAKVKSLKETWSAIEQMTNADFARLSEIGDRYVYGIALQGQDLLQEAIEKALMGKRKWRADLSLVAFLKGVMKSIASNIRRHMQDDGAAKRNENEKNADTVKIQRDDMGGKKDVPLKEIFNTVELSEEPVQSQDPTPEKIIIDREAAELLMDKIHKAIDGRDQEKEIVDALGEDLTPEEARELLSIDKTEYNSRRRNIRRAINNTYPGGLRDE